MRKEYDFSKAVKNPHAARLKRQATFRLNEGVVSYFGKLASRWQAFYLDYPDAENYNQNTMKPSMKFDIKKTVQYWLEGAEYDLGVADAMFEKR